MAAREHELRRTERADGPRSLEEENARLQTLADNVPEGAVYRYRHRTDGSVQFDYISAGIEALTGVRAEEILRDASALHDRILGEDRVRLVGAEASSRDSLAPFELEVRQRHRVTGELRWALLRSVPTRLPSGETVWDGIHVDITRRKRAEEALRESEDRYRTLVELAPDGVLVHHEGTIVFANPAVAAIAGVASPEALVGQKVLDFLLAEDRAKSIARIQQVLQGGKIPIEVLRVQGRDGRERRCQSTAGRVEFQGRTCVQVVLRDVSELLQAEDSLRKAHHQLVEIVESIQDGFLALDREWRFTFVNRRAASSGGKEPEELIGRNLWECFPAILGTPLERSYRKVMEERVPVHFEHQGSSGVWYSTSIYPSRDGLTLFWRDITARKQAESLGRALSRINQVVHSALDFDAILRAAIGEAVAALGADTAAASMREGDGWRVRCVHGLPEETLGLRMNDDEERHAVLAIESKVPVLSADAFNDERLNREHLRKWGIRSVLTVPLVVRDGAMGVVFFNFQKRAMPLGEAHADFGAKLASAISLALENAKLVESLRKTEKSLREADARKNEFLATLSHELRNPLAPIRNSLYVLDRAAPGGEQARRAKAVIDRQVDQLARLVDDLLDLTRITCNKIQLQRQRLEVGELVRRTCEDHRAELEKAELALEIALPKTPVTVDADPNRLAQAVGNLLQNSAKFTPRDGRVLVSVTLDEPAARVAIRVADTGVGIAPEMLGRLFQPFMQAEQSLDRSRGGLGLGLALVKGLVELHGGEIQAESEGLGRGAAFTLCLPVARASATVAGQGGHQGRPGRRRVLIVEDRRDTAESLRDLLELEGHEAAVALDGARGLALARELLPEVVFCDIGLPGMDGYEIARAIRRDPRLNGTLLVALSGYALPEDLKRAAEAGFDRHLAKPLCFEKLAELLQGPDRR